jgi:hypothetical protein
MPPPDYLPALMLQHFVVLAIRKAVRLLMGPAVCTLLRNAETRESLLHRTIIAFQLIVVESFFVGRARGMPVDHLHA